jgi:hypothetical protein
MRIENLLFSAVQFFLTVVIACAGLFFIALPWAPQVRFAFAAFITQRDDLFIPLGGLLLAIAVVLGVGFYFLQRKAYFQVKMSPAVYVEKELLRALLAGYWKDRFPEDKLKTDIVLHKNHQIEFVAELPFLKASESQKLLRDVESEVGRLVVQQLGYKRDFIFTFQLK